MSYFLRPLFWSVTQSSGWSENVACFEPCLWPYVTWKWESRCELNHPIIHVYELLPLIVHNFRKFFRSRCSWKWNGTTYFGTRWLGNEWTMVACKLFVVCKYCDFAACLQWSFKFQSIKQRCALHIIIAFRGYLMVWRIFFCISIDQPQMFQVLSLNDHHTIIC